MPLAINHINMFWLLKEVLLTHDLLKSLLKFENSFIWYDAFRYSYIEILHITT